MQHQSFPGRTIFVVEDDTHLGVVLQIMLKRHGFGVVLAADGDVARQLIDASSHPPSLVLLDVLMPYADGYETMRTMRNRDGWQSVPVVMLSACSSEEDVVRAFELGADDYVTKPFHTKELMARINRLVREEA